MKALNKIISLTMAAVMVITAMPVVQAAELANNLNTEELSGLMEDVTSSVADVQNEREIKPVYENIPDLETLKARYNIKIEKQKGVRKYVKTIKKKAENLIATDSRFEGLHKNTQNRLAFFTVLRDDLIEAVESESAGKATTNTMKSLNHNLFINIAKLAYISMVLDAYMYSFFLLLLYSDQPKLSYFNVTLDDPNPADTISWQFASDPYYALHKFGAYGVDDFGTMYYAGEKTAQLLWDAIDIRYYTYQNPTEENLKEFLYMQSIDWYDLSWKKQIEHLHNWAVHLRAEARILAAGNGTAQQAQ